MIEFVYTIGHRHIDLDIKKLEINKIEMHYVLVVPPRTLYMLVVCEYVIYKQTTKTGMKNITTIVDDTNMCGSGVASPIFDSFRSNKIHLLDHVHGSKLIYMQFQLSTSLQS